MRLIFLLWILIGCIACSDSSKVSGTATDTENMVAGLVLTSKQKAAVNASVQMLSREAAYGKNLVLAETKTDSSGSFEFLEFPVDSFDLEIKIHNDSGSVLEIGSVRDLSISDTSFLKIALEKPAVLKGAFDYQENISNMTIGSVFRLAVERSSVQMHIFAGDSFQISVLPGDINFAFFPSEEQVVLRLQEEGFEDSLVYQEYSAFVESGDTLDLANVMWQIGEKKESSWEVGSVLSGKVKDSTGAPIAGAMVRVITDIYGLSFALAGAPVETDYVYTDSNGVWVLPFPSKMEEDSIRIETELSNGYIAESPFISLADLEKHEGDTLHVPSLMPQEPSSINLNIRLVVNMEDSTQVDNCYMNSVIVGLVGTSKFKQIITCAPMDLPGLPSGEHNFIFYTSDIGVLKVLQEREESRDSYMRFMGVTLTPGAVLNRQGITYTPPTL